MQLPDDHSCCHAGATSWQRLSAAEGELAQSNLVLQRQLEEAADAWGRQMADMQAACEHRLAGTKNMNVVTQPKTLYNGFSWRSMPRFVAAVLMQVHVVNNCMCL